MIHEIVFICSILSTAYLLTLSVCYLMLVGCVWVHAATQNGAVAGKSVNQSSEITGQKAKQ